MNLKPQSSYSGVVCKKEIDSDVMLIELIKDNEHPSDNELNEDNDVGGEEFEGNHFDKFLTCDELAYHKYLMHDPYLSKIVRDPIIKRGNPSNLKIPCNIGHVHIVRAYIDLDSPLNIMSRSCYNWIMTARLAPRKNPKSPSGLNNFMGRVKGMHIFVGNFTYVSDFMIIEDISLFIDLRVSHVVLGKPFVELSGMTYDSSLGVVRLTNGNEEIAYKMPHKIEKYDSVLNDEKENMKLVYLRNDEDKKKGVEYIISKILGFYKECLELGPEYRNGQDESSSGTSENQSGVTTRSIEHLCKATKESKKTRRRQLGIGGLSEGTANVILEWGSEIKSEQSDDSQLNFDDKEKKDKDGDVDDDGDDHISDIQDQGDDEEVDWIDFDEYKEKKDDIDDDKSINLKMTDDEETNDEFVHSVEQVNDDEDEEMTNIEVEESGNGDEENTDAAKTDAGKTEEVKMMPRKLQQAPSYRYL
ncbi:MAK10-like protein [Tanacetum coccineum]